MHKLRSLSFTVAAASFALACGGTPSDLARSSASTAPLDQGSSGNGPHLCAALRGNGELIYAHFASLARLTEQFGLFDAMAGGSSSTITMFVYESMLLNPALTTCTNDDGTTRSCTSGEVTARAALLLKSVRGYAEAVGLDDGILGDDGILQLAEQAKEQGLDSLADTDPVTAAAQIQQLLSPDAAARLSILVNPELVDMLSPSDPTLLSYNEHEVLASIEEFGSFSVADNRLFFRPGLVDFDAAAGTTFARAGDFYAGYGPADTAGMQHFLDQCAAPTAGLLWVDPNGGNDITQVTSADGSPCAQLLADMATAFTNASNPDGPSYASRIDDPVGGTLNVLAATSVVTGASIQAYADARQLYLSGQYPTGSIPFNVSFDDVKFGYWGAPASLSQVLSNPEGYGDLKTQKASSLGQASWRDVLSRSPAEPGLARLRELADGSGQLAAGGWPDLAPVLALKNLGCDRVVYVTRRQPESTFAIGVATNLGMSPAEQTDLYDLSNAQSSFTDSLRASTATWCTNWNAFADSQQDAMAADAYSAPLETTDAFFSGYTGVTPSTGFAGCTPGVAQ